MKNWLQHNLNSMHIYCRLCKFLPKAKAMYISQKWEKIIHPMLYHKR
jgi:hypothetical protein